MKRLTEKDPYWMGEEFWSSAREPDDEEVDCVYRKLWEYENVGLEPEEVLDLVKLVRVLGMKKSSTLPVKNGETVYRLFKDVFIYPGSITAITIFNDGNFTFWVSFDPEPLCEEFCSDDLGKTIFFTREAAEEYKKNDGGQL